jgi:hypothetical protein
MKTVPAIKVMDDLDVMAYAEKRTAIRKEEGSLTYLASEDGERQGPSVDSKTPVAVVKAELTRHSKARSLDELGPYKHAFVVSEYRVLDVLEGKFVETRLLAVQFAIKNRKPQPAMNVKKGEVYRLSIGPWAAQKDYQQQAIDDDIIDLETPMYFVFKQQPN